MDNKRTRGIGGAGLVIILVAVFAVLWLTNQFESREHTISQSQFEDLVDKDNVAFVIVHQNKSVPTGRLEITLNESTDEEDTLRYLYVSDVNEIQEYLQEKN